MRIAIPLEQMSVSDKLRAIEEIWSDLARAPEDIPSPSWHADVLRAREQRIADGTSRFLGVEDAKQAVRGRMSLTVVRITGYRLRLRTVSSLRKYRLRGHLQSAAM